MTETMMRFSALKRATRVAAWLWHAWAIALARMAHGENVDYGRLEEAALAGLELVANQLQPSNTEEVIGKITDEQFADDPYGYIPHPEVYEDGSVLIGIGTAGHGYLARPDGRDKVSILSHGEEKLVMVVDGGRIRVEKANAPRPRDYARAIRILAVALNKDFDEVASLVDDPVFPHIREMCEFKEYAEDPGPGVFARPWG